MKFLGYLDQGIYLGILLLVLLILRHADPSSGWRAALALCCILSLSYQVAARHFPWSTLESATKKLLGAWLGLIVLVTLTSLAGETFTRSSGQFWQGFVLPVLLPWLMVTHCRGERSRRWVVFALTGAVLLTMGKNAYQYLGEISSLGRLSSDIHLHRRYAEALVFGLPFLLVLLFKPGAGWLKLIQSGIVLVAGLMIVATGARGAWLGAAAGALVVLVALGNRRIWMISAAVLVVATALAVISVPGELLEGRIRQGFDTSHRTSGTWRPALEMIADHPLTGYGFGDDVFHAEFNRRAPGASHWSLKTSLGAHSFYLSTAFAAGIPGLALLLGIVGVLVRRLLKAVRPGPIKWNPGRTDYDAIALLGSLTGIYLVMGLVENINWHLLGLWLGLALIWLESSSSAKGASPH